MLITLLSIFQSWLLHINTNILLVLTQVPWKCSAPLHIIAWRLRSALTSQSWNRVLCFSVCTLSEQSLSAEHQWKETPLGKPFHKYLTTLNSIFDVKTSQGAAFGSGSCHSIRGLGFKIVHLIYTSSSLLGLYVTEPFHFVYQFWEASELTRRWRDKIEYRDKIMFSVPPIP